MKKIVVDPDLLIEHVAGTSAQGPSDLRRLLGVRFCYTTVFNAIEAFSVCGSQEERDAVEHAMHAMKVLGLNAKSGKNLGELLSSAQGGRDLHALTAGVCMESRLPLVTRRPQIYRPFSGLILADPTTVLGS